MSAPGRPRHIAVEGPVGSGKTQLAVKLAQLLGARTLLEPVGENPFLEPFQKDPQKFAFQTQVFFMLNRHQQLQSILQEDLFTGGTVTDFLFERERIFAAIHLSPAERALYDRIYQVVRERVPKPDLVVYLQARPDVLLERVRRREERNSPRSALRDLEELSRVYNDFFFHYDASPLLVVNTSDLHPGEDDDEARALAVEIMRPVGGARHYIPRR